VKISFLPRSRLGKWSSGLSIVGFLLFSSMAIFPVIDSILNSDLLFTIFATLIFAMLIAPCVTGTIAVIKSKDRSILVFIAILLSLIFVVFLIMMAFDFISLPDQM